MNSRWVKSPIAAVLPAVFLLNACSDKGPQAGELLLSAANYSVEEGAGTATITVFRNGPNLTQARVNYAVSAGSATAGADFTTVSGTLSWDVGDAEPKSIVVPILEDTIIEGNETFTVTLSEPFLADLGSPATATVTIIDNDAVGDSVGLVGNQLVTFNRAAPASATSVVTVSGLAAGETLVGLDRRPADGALIALSTAGKLYTIDAGTGAATLKSTLIADPTDTSNPYASLSGARFGVDFNPVPDRLRVVSDTGLNLRINVDTGATITDGVINGAATGYSTAAYTNSFGAACRTALYAIDAQTNQLLLQNPPNDGTAVVVGPLGVDVDAVNAFDIATDAAGANSAFAALSVSGSTALYSINLSTGAATRVAALPLATSAYSGLALSIASGSRPQAAGDTLGLTESSKLVSFNRAAPAKLCTSTAVSGLGAGEALVGFDTRPADGLLYALSNASKLYTIDKTTAAATLKSTLTTALAGSEFGVDFNPVPDRLRVTSDTGQNLRIDVSTGATTVDGALNVGGSARGATAVGYTNSLAGGNAASLTTTTYYLDSANDQLLTSTNPNAGELSVVGSLGVDVSGINGFDINGSDNTATIAVNAQGTTTTTLHTIDLATGAASASLGTVGGGERLLGVTAFAAPAVATVYGLTSGDELVKFSPATPGTVTTVGALSGLQGGESVLGLDFRPSTGKLYAFTSAGRLYTVDTATAALTAASTLAADASDTSDAFAGLGADSVYGVDFNPTGPVALRIVGNAGRNLRVGNPDAGNTFTDGALSYGTFGVSGAAYTNSFAGTATTSLFVIDPTSDRLFLQAPPNDGVLKDRGPLGVDASSVNGFDIVGVDTAFAALTVNAVTSLYRIDVSSAFSAARATSIGAIGVSGSVKGLAIATATVAPADPTIVALVGAAGVDSLVSFAASAPATVSAPVIITGLAVGDALIDIDFRPATGALYGLSGSGAIYTIDTVTGFATAVPALTADPTDTTAPYTGLNGTALGIDFNPVPDRLRVVTDAGQNLRINVGNGITITDGTLTRPPQAVAAAYTNSFRASTATQLFVLDGNSAGLSLQAPPNDGVLRSINTLGVNLTDASAIGFDIAGGANGFALAALVVDGATQSSLFRVNLATGQATLVAPIGVPTPLRALSIEVK
ncbi:DUF4394 domain-containing protein [Hydrocarboniphaga effusa]|jgi:hypothetical protein|uniref:DUF4394 domain-containing protein n=3 Tax=Hydrocarboniphaga effusa TaxID=243629 RepID=UPI003BAA29C5